MSLAILLAAAAEKEAPLIDLDGTVLIQFGIFVVMAAILWSFVFKPYLKVRDDREKGIAGARVEAKEMEERSVKVSADLEGQIRAARQKGVEERARLRAEGAEHERQVLGAARDAAQKAIGEARGKAKREQDAARAQLLAEAGKLAAEAATRLVGRPL